MRASDSDRARAEDVLKAGYAEGRLSKHEFDQRMAHVHSATTYGELHHLLADLPQGPSPMPAPAPATFQPAPMPYAPARPWSPVPAPPPQTNGSAVGALVCGVLCPFTWGVTSIPAVILGHKARSDVRRTGEKGDGMALAGLILGYLTLAGWMLLLFGIAIAGI
ncbi:DUF4190 domain-containing protein [Streptomyces alkaliphilus]|uniref:DUF4190 domain-containing protein n=2 Tax=Streptomyces alkaliphilus TaxID=1472722 RepID=A0A7W3TFE9_9ACTN|nr:DUF4190 domain-containing protein [Streptomyces alkaliphilus]MQS07681.1 DUF4190 domain-containing protein [Streptomyces alkaliphilus]